MVDNFIREIRLVIENQCNVIFAGDVFRGDDGELVPGDVACKRDVLDATTSHLTPDRGSVNHVWERNVVDIQRLAGDFLPTFFAWRRFTDGMMICLRAHRDLRLAQDKWLL